MATFTRWYIIDRLFFFSLGLLCLTSSASKMYWHSHLPRQPRISIAETPAVIITASVGELCLGSVLVVGLRSSLVRRLTISVFSLFLCVAVIEAIAGSKSCGCFGSGVHIPPWYMVGFDFLAVMGLLILCTKSQPSSERTSIVTKLKIALAVTLIVVGAGIIAVWEVRKPLMVVGHSNGVHDNADPFGTPGMVVLLDPGELIGKPFSLSSHIDIHGTIMTGDWILLLVHHDCDVCVGAVPRYQSASSVAGAAKLAIIEMPPYAGSGVIVPWTTSTGFFGKLDTTREWFATTPVAILLKDGIVQSATDGDRAAAPNPAWLISRRGPIP